MLDLPFLAAAAIIVLAGAAFLMWRSERTRTPAKDTRRRMAEELAVHFDYRKDDETRRQFIEGCVAGMWFVENEPGSSAIRATYELTMQRLRVGEDNDWHYDLGWAIAVRGAWLRAGGQRHCKTMDPAVQAPPRPQLRSVG